MDTLWPDESPELVTRRLSVALATIRAVLDPAKQHPADRFVIGDNDAVRLDLTNVPIDVEQFLATAADGLAAYTHAATSDATAILATAARSYRGDFLEEDPYEDWAAPLRDEARTTYIAVVRALAEAATRAGDVDDAVAQPHAGARQGSLGRERPPRPRGDPDAGRAARRGPPQLRRVQVTDGGDPSAGGTVPVAQPRLTPDACDQGFNPALTPRRHRHAVDSREGRDMNDAHAEQRIGTGFLGSLGGRHRHRGLVLAGVLAGLRRRDRDRRRAAPRTIIVGPVVAAAVTGVALVRLTRPGGPLTT